MEILVEPLSKDHSYEAAKLLSGNFGDKFTNLTKLCEEDLASLVHEELFEHYSEDHERCFIAKADGAVAGVVYIEWGQKSARKQSFRERSGKYGMINTMRFNMGMRALAVQEKEGNCYLAKLAVSKDFRGMGVASFLVEEAIRFAREKEFRMITLYVSPANDNAIALYQKYGFIEEKRIRSPVEKILFNVPGWIYMTKVIGE